MVGEKDSMELENRTRGSWVVKPNWASFHSSVITGIFPALCSFLALGFSSELPKVDGAQVEEGGGSLSDAAP